MVSLRFGAKVGPGLIAPARLFFVACLAAAVAPAVAQTPVTAPAASQAGVPDPIVINKLVWSAMAALDQANQTGNYSVLRDLGAPSFQTNNSAATLGGIFQAIRNQQVDLGYTLVVAPTYQFPPAIVQGGLLRVRGTFPLRPATIGFDLLFQNISGQWRIFGIAVAPIVAQPPQSGSTRR
ncbi:MAG: hypothetical protein QOJ27_2754 [Sphingomonadales bacterium]|nr:hypothetical protein [Sphingomonadales bacterium]